jgi:hypothetical protein
MKCVIKLSAEILLIGSVFGPDAHTAALTIISRIEITTAFIFIRND